MLPPFASVKVGEGVGISQREPLALASPVRKNLFDRGESTIFFAEIPNFANFFFRVWGFAPPDVVSLAPGKRLPRTHNSRTSRDPRFLFCPLFRNRRETMKNPSWIRAEHGTIFIGKIAVGEYYREDRLRTLENRTVSKMHATVDIPTKGRTQRDCRKYPCLCFETSTEILHGSETLATQKLLFSVSGHLAARKSTVCRRLGWPQNTDMHEFARKVYAGEKTAIPAGLFAQKGFAEELNTTQPRTPCQNEVCRAL